MSHPRRPAQRAFPLHLAPGRALGLVSVPLALAFGFLLLALGNDRGLVWMGLLELSPQAATRLYASLVAVVGLFVFPAACAVAAKGLWLDQRVAFVAGGLLLPAGFWSSSEVVVAFADILDLAVTRFGEERILTLTLAERTFSIGSAWLPGEQAFDEIVERVSATTLGTSPTAA